MEHEVVENAVVILRVTGKISRLRSSRWFSTTTGAASSGNGRNLPYRKFLRDEFERANIMDGPVTITEVEIRLADKPKGRFIGWASCVFNNSFLLSNIAIHHSERGGIFLTFPRKKTKRGVEYLYYKPITRAAYEDIRKAIFSKLALLGRETQ
jgi:DNA-binding cell septation regulator SpoVG